MQTYKWSEAALGLFIFALGFSIIFFETMGFKAFTRESARRLLIEDNPVNIKSVTLQNTTLDFISFEDYKDKVLLVDFIYTRCPTVCNLLGSSFKNLQTKIDALGLGDDIVLISVSFDLEYDTPTKLAEYRERFGGIAQNWKVVVPKTKSDLEKLKQDFGVIVIPDKWGGFVHNAAIHVLDKNKQLVKIVDWDESPQLFQMIENIYDKPKS